MSKPPHRSVIQPHVVTSTITTPLAVDTTAWFSRIRDEALNQSIAPTITITKQAKMIHPVDEESCDAIAIALSEIAPETGRPGRGRDLQASCDLGESPQGVTWAHLRRFTQIDDVRKEARLSGHERGSRRQASAYPSVVDPFNDPSLQAAAQGRRLAARHRLAVSSPGPARIRRDRLAPGPLGRDPGSSPGYLVPGSSSRRARRCSLPRITGILRAAIRTRSSLADPHALRASAWR